uniref:G-protein coupled receptors family 1 profile domain-containing protein n=1 Tax=Acrobeloides nanus TaxID=290746 RepID=A0A914DHT0_9BILA
MHFSSWLGLAVSGLSLTLLNVDKLIYFLWPLDYDRTMSKQRAAFLCTIIWGVPLGFVSYVWAFNIVYVSDDCNLDVADLRKYFYEVFVVVFSILPVISSLFVSIYLFRLTHQKKGVYMASSQIDMPTLRAKVKSLVSIFATTVWTSFSLLPYRIFNIYRKFLLDWHAMGCEQRDIHGWLAWLLLYLLIVHPIVNPIITAIVYAQYRISIKKLLINLSICTRLCYSYRGETTETSFLSKRRRRAHNNSSTANHEISIPSQGHWCLRQAMEMSSSLNNCDAALTASIAEEPNGNIGEDNVETVA